jgi:hypothetical protein
MSLRPKNVHRAPRAWGHIILLAAALFWSEHDTPASQQAADAPLVANSHYGSVGETGLELATPGAQTGRHFPMSTEFE